MASRAQMAAGVGLAGVALVAGVAWLQQARLRLAWWDTLAVQGPGADVLAELQRCGSPGWTGWVTVASSDMAMPCGEATAARALSERLDPSLRRAWLEGRLASATSPRVRWRLTRALELAGAPVRTSTVTLLLDGTLEVELAAELMLSDGGARDPREVWTATALRAARGEPLDALPWQQVVDRGWLSGDAPGAVQALRGALQVPADVDPRLHEVPEGWVPVLEDALACDGRACLGRWQQVALAWEASPEGEGLPREDGTGGEVEEVDPGLWGPLLAWEQVERPVVDAVVRLIGDQATMARSEQARPWLGIGEEAAVAGVPATVWTGRMGPWTQALWARDLALRADLDGEVRRSSDHLVVTLGATTRTLCGKGAVKGKLDAVLDDELVARALLEMHPDAVAAASRLAGWTGPDHPLFGATGATPPPQDPCE